MTEVSTAKALFDYKIAGVHDLNAKCKLGIGEFVTYL